jgi:hypothetical protein
MQLKKLEIHAQRARSLRVTPIIDEMAGATGLEPAASGVTGRRSNQLSYAPFSGVTRDLNALPPQVKARRWKRFIMGSGRVLSANQVRETRIKPALPSTKVRKNPHFSL